MSDLDKLLRDSLGGAAESYEPAHEAEARRAFLRRAGRRRIFAGGSVVLAGAALVAILFFAASDLDSPSTRDDGTASSIPSTSVVARTRVGDAPAGVAVGRGSVWVANSGDGTVSVIDAKTNRVTDTVEVGGTPLGVEHAGGHAWVSFENTTRLVAIDGDDLSQREVELDGGGTNLAIAAGGRHLWAVSPDTPLQRIDAATLGVTEHSITVDEPVNLTVGGGKVWVLGAEGAVDQIDAVSGLDPEMTHPLDAPVGVTSTDLAWDGVSLWISDGDGRGIIRLDPQAGLVTANVEFEGRYANLAASLEGELWALVGNDSSRARLLLVDTDTGTAAPGSITLPGSPGGIVAQDRSVWTVGASSDRVFRSELRSRSVVSSEEGDRIPADEILYIYPEAGDLVAVHGDTRGTAVMHTSEDESNPSFVSENTIAFERTDASGEVTVVTRNLETGTEAVTPIVGHEVAVGPDGRAAWILPSNDQSEQTQIRIGSLDGSGEDFFVANPEFEALTVRNLEWDPSGSKLYYEAGRDSVGLYEVDVEDPQPRAIDPPEDSATYLAPAVTESDEVVVLKVCCSGQSGSRTIELGRLELGNGAPEYSKIVGVDDAGFNANSSNITLEPAGTLDVEAEGGDELWTVTSVRAWILSDGTTAWLMDEEGEIDLLRPTNVTGAAVNPAFLD